MKLFDGTALSLNDTIIYFYANWMPQHKKMMNIIKNLDEYQYEVLVVDVESFKDFTKANNVTCVPTFIFFKDEKQISKIEGMQLSSVIHNQIYKIYKDKL